MMTATDVMGYLKAEPFRAFQILTASGKSFDVRHPEMMRVGTTFIMIFTFVDDTPELFDRWETVSLMLIEHISLLDVTAGQS